MADEGADEEEVTVAGHEFSRKEAAGMAVLTFVALVGVRLAPASMETIFSLDFGTLLNPGNILLGLVLVPSIYATAISLRGFRKETLVSFIALPAFMLGGTMAVAAVAIPLAVIMAGYISRSMFNDKNYFYTFYRSTASMLFVLALVTAVFTAHTVYSDEAVRDRMQASIANETTNTALSVFNMTSIGQEGIGSGVTDQIVEEQKQLVSDWAYRISENSSALAVQGTEQLVLTTAERSGQFNDQQDSILQNAFDQAESSLPAMIAENVSGQTEQLLEQQAADQDIGQDVSVQQPDVKGMIGRNVDNVLDTVFQYQKLVAGLVALIVFSTLMILRLPVGLAAGVVGYLIHRLWHI